MRIGILTLRSFSFGNFLQMYALYNAILTLGYRPIIINYIPKPYSEPYPYIIRLHGFNKGIRSIITKIFDEHLYLGFIKRSNRELVDYYKQLEISKPIKGIEELHRIVEELDNVIVGSDWVWSPEYPLYYHEYGYLLPFTLNKTLKIAYSASFGWDNVSKLPSHILYLYKKYISDFDFISLREKSHIPFLSNLIGNKKPVHHTIDPTLLLDKEWWSMKISRTVNSYLENLLSEKFVFVCNVEANLLLRLKSVLRELWSRDYYLVIYKLPRLIPAINALESISFTLKSFYIRNKKVMIVEYIDPFELLWIVKNAERIITDSLHGTIFSIIFEKPFVAVKRPGSSVRILDLLDILNIRDRFAKTINEVSKILKEEIDYKTVRPLINYYRQRSWELLKVAISLSK
jgi:hypothetical protein